MEKLPQELINSIVEYSVRYPDQQRWRCAKRQYFLHDSLPSHFPRLAILNRAWKEAVESITFQRLYIRSDELALLRSIVTGNRRKYLAWISFTAILPNHSGEAHRYKGSRLRQSAINEAFTKHINDMFQLLRTWEESGVRNALTLDIQSALSPIDHHAHDRYPYSTTEEAYLPSPPWQPSYLCLVHPESLPALSNVHHLIIQNIERQFVPSIAPDLASSLPELRTVRWGFQDCDADRYEKLDRVLLHSDSGLEQELFKFPSTRGEARAEFANKLLATRFHSLNSATISFHRHLPDNQKLDMSTILPNGLTHDPFSSSLRIFSQRLTTFVLEAQVDSTLFWPSDENASPPSWPHLKRMDIQFHMVGPSGKWYFTGPLPYTLPNDDLNYRYRDFRYHPDPKTFDPFLDALSKAVAHMPALDCFMLTCDSDGSMGKLHIAYHGPGDKAKWDDEEDAEDQKYRRIYYAYEGGRKWSPRPETAARLRDAGMQKYGGEVIERDLGSLYMLRNSRHPPRRLKKHV